MTTYTTTISARDISPYTDRLFPSELGAYIEAAAEIAAEYQAERAEALAAELGDDDLTLRVRAARREESGSVLQLVGSAYRDLEQDLRGSAELDTHPLIAARQDMLAHIADHWSDVEARVRENLERDRDDDGLLIDRAVALLGATSVAPGVWRYRDDATRATWEVTDEDLADLGLRLRRRQRDAYSLWCADRPATLVEREDA